MDSSRCPLEALRVPFFVGGSLDGDTEDIYIYTNMYILYLHTGNNYPIILIFIYM